VTTRNRASFQTQLTATAQPVALVEPVRGYQRVESCRRRHDDAAQTAMNIERSRFMAKRKKRTLARTRTVVVYRNGVLGYYARDRVEGGISPTYSTEAILSAARVARAQATASGARARWTAAS
jgi:hypothetical protein